jgi:hypothetical protein
MQRSIKIIRVVTCCLRVRQQSYNYAKERFDVGLMNAFDLSRQTLLATAQSEVLRTKYDYIFKIKNSSFILESNYQKLIYHVKKNNLYYPWWSYSSYRFFNRL